MKNEIEECQNWYEKEYVSRGFKAQRLYPNEELLRFLGRNYFSLDSEQRQNIKILEVGSGSCSNLWMIAREGFKAYGIDLSESSVKLGESMLAHWKVQAELSVGSMHQMPYPNASMDVIVDVFSSYCLPKDIFLEFIIEMKRVLIAGGKFFIYTPSGACEDFMSADPSSKMDEFTLKGIYRKESPFYGNFYPFRFESVEHLSETLRSNGFRVDYCETLTRSYKGGKENFQHLVLEATKL